MQIQPHGYTFMLNDNYEVVNYSKNLIELDGLASKEIINQPLQKLIDENSWQNLHSSLEEQKSHIFNGFDVYFRSIPEKKFNASIFYDGENRFLEIEPATGEKKQLPILNKWILNASHILHSIQDLSSVYTTSLEILNEILDYDKALFLKYNEVFDAEILGVLSDQNDEYLVGNYFIDYDEKQTLSKEDQFRLIRYIPDTQYAPVSFQINNTNQNAHIGNYWTAPEKLYSFLEQIGVKSYISFNIRINEKLWGKISFFSHTIKPLNLKKREAAISVFQQISSVIAMKLLQEMQQREANFQTLHAKITNAMASSEHHLDGLKKESQSLMNMANSSGVAWKLEGKLERFGLTPDDAQINRIVRWIDTSSDEKRSVFYTHCLSKLNQEFDSVKDKACGVFYLNILSQHDEQFIIWFRKEKVKTTLQLKSEINKGLNQDSFDKSNKRGYSESWNKGDIDNAVQLKNNISNYIIQSSERLKKQNQLLEKIVKDRTKSLREEIKKRKAAEKKIHDSVEELRRSNHELENFAYVASHDLQEPLRKIQAFSDRLKKVLSDELDERAGDYFNRLTNAAGRMQKLINDLLSYSRVTTHAKPFSEVNLDGLLEGVISDLNISITEKHAEIRLDKFGTVEGDEHQLQRLFQNLIQNALKFHKKNAVPAIDIINKSIDSETLIIAVKDNGIGFEESYANKIFHLFERLHGRGEYEGTGLGLAICKKIVERHGGQIKTESKPGEGAEFIISLPVTHAL